MEAEVDRLAGPGAADKLDFEALETAVRRRVLALAARVVERDFNEDRSDHVGPRRPCPCGSEARYAGRHPKTFETVLGPLTLQRAYYYCQGCHQGCFPRDQQLGLERTSLSPATVRMTGSAAALVSFAEASGLLAELAGVRVEAKQVERVAEGLGREIAAAEREGTVEPEPPSAPTMYLGLDGTGVPVRQTERAGRAGKQPDGTAKTREAELVLVWTAETRNPQGRPVRDPGSVSYSGAIESAASRDTDPDLSAFAQRVGREAERRGFPNAARRVVLGDGAAWIWNLSSEQFPGAIQIVDLWHAKEHLWEVSKVLHAGDPGRVEAWAQARCHELEAGSLDNLLQVLRSRADQCESAQRMRRLRRAQPPQDALRGVPRAGPVCGFRSGRGGLQDGDRHAIEKGRDALDRRRGQRHHRPALLQAQRSLRGLLGKPVTQFMRSSQNHVVRPALPPYLTLLKAIC